MGSLKRISTLFSNHITQIILVVLIYFIFTVIFTYPLIIDLNESVPSDLGDPLLNIWTLWWDMEQMIHLNISNYFNANVMFPYKNALAFSEHLTGEAILGLPFYILFRNPLTVYNILYLLSFVIAGFGTYLLTYKLTNNKFASFVAGFIYTFVPHRFGQIGHIQTLYSGFFPICFLFLIRFIDNLKMRDALLLSVFIIIQSLMNMYYVVYLAITMLTIGIPYAILRGRIFKIRLHLLSILIIVIAIITLLPFLLPYIELREAFGLQRDISTIASLPDIKNLIGINRINQIHSTHFKFLDINEGSFFLGISVSLLAIAGIIGYGLNNIYKIIFIILMTISFLIIAGPEPSINYKSLHFNYGFLYRFFYQYFPAFDGTRVPMRFYIFIVLSISLFAGSTFVFLDRFKNRIIKLTIFTILFIPIVIEYSSKVPIIKYNLFSKPPEILKRLKYLEDGAVIFFPLRETYSHILYASIINKPVYTSFTGYTHFLNKRVEEIEREPSSQNTLNLFKALGIKYVVVLNLPLKNRFDEITGGESIKIEKIYDRNDGAIYKLDYTFKGYFEYKDFSDMNLSFTRDKIIIHLYSNNLQDGPKIPLRLFFNVELRLKKANRVIERKKLLLRVQDVIEQNPVSRLEYNHKNKDFDEIEMTIYGENKSQKLTLKKDYIFPK
ncbi:MAG: hypothetical protein ACP5QK_02210 [Myxococcota bacterium]